MKGRKTPLRLGLTGAPGAGKSTVLSFFRRAGVPVLEADRVAKEVLRDVAVRRRLKKVFGEDFWDGRGKINKALLAARAFQSRKTQQALNRIVHPRVRSAIRAWVGRQSRRKRPPAWVVVEVPLLFERGFHRFFHATLCVAASHRLRRARLREKRGWSLSQIRKRESLQWPQGKKCRMADAVLWNNTTRVRLRRCWEKWWRVFRKEAVLRKRKKR